MAIHEDFQECRDAGLGPRRQFLHIHEYGDGALAGGGDRLHPGDQAPYGLFDIVGALECRYADHFHVRVDTGEKLPHFPQIGRSLGLYLYGQAVRYRYS